jgi:hypothetical protein
MAQMSLSELSSAATLAQDPSLTSAYLPKLGGVDPLGLRQINFDLMDVVLPGLNNVASHIRPFTVVSWAWRRAAICARDLGQSNISVDALRDFVDRIEVIYAWSQFQQKADTDLPAEITWPISSRRISTHSAEKPGSGDARPASILRL